MTRARSDYGRIKRLKRKKSSAAITKMRAIDILLSPYSMSSWKIGTYAIMADMEDVANMYDTFDFMFNLVREACE